MTALARKSVAAAVAGLVCASTAHARQSGSSGPCNQDHHRPQVYWEQDANREIFLRVIDKIKKGEAGTVDPPLRGIPIESRLDALWIEDSSAVTSALRFAIFEWRSFSPSEAEVASALYRLHSGQPRPILSRIHSLGPGYTTLNGLRAIRTQDLIPDDEGFLLRVACGIIDALTPFQGTARQLSTQWVDIGIMLDSLYEAWRLLSVNNRRALASSLIDIDPSFAADRMNFIEQEHQRSNH